MLRSRVRMIGLGVGFTATLLSAGQTTPNTDQGLPAGTVRLSTVMQRISSEPDYSERVQALLGSKGNKGFLTAGLMQDLRKLILGRDWQRVDHFPSFTIGALNQSVRVAERAAGKSTPSTDNYAPDIGTYSLAKNLTVDLNARALKPAYANDPSTAVKKLPYDLVMGDGPNPELAPHHADSVRLAQVLNRLAQNPSGNPSNAPHKGRPIGTLTLKVGKISNITTSDQLLQALTAEGESVTVVDARYFANFAHLHDGDHDVLAPFWIDTQIVVPGENRPLAVPVSHSEYELHVRGPKLDADVSFYFGIDGKAQFRTMDSQDQAWVMSRYAHTFTGEQAQSAIRMLSAALRVYKRVHTAHPELAFGGYYTLGVCQDASAAIEQHLEGTTTLFPLTHEPEMFPSSAAETPDEQEFLKEFNRLPSDRGNAAPEISRVLGALPASDANAISIPELRADLAKVTATKHLAALQRTPSIRERLTRWLWALIVCFALVVILVWFLIRRAAKKRKTTT